MSDFANAAAKGELDVKAISRRQYDDRARAFFEERKHLLSQVGTRTV
ncbi:MAG: hypothetical protein GY948_01650 [Alphaproteobacteria bacterium]|nr:hypothetical protein [Alphaproteobacteria bacterium]